MCRVRGEEVKCCRGLRNSNVCRVRGEEVKCVQVLGVEVKCVQVRGEEFRCAVRASYAWPIPSKHTAAR